MKINSSQENVTVIGDVKKFKTSIDPRNLEFITTLLSSNLYSDPEQSFIREIVSNAWDSHVEAGTTDIPVIIKFSGDSISIRDYGTGLSPERFEEIYCNIGSSTKRESNEFIGGFGIGKYSALACSNTVYITSYYEGKAYYYVMVKSGNSITTNLLMEKDTEEKNGVEVSIKGIINFYSYNKALQYIIFFPNIYVHGASDADNINSAKLKRFKYFAASSIPVDSKLLLGNVLYPIQYKLFSRDIQDFIFNISATGIVVKFDIGELDVTPNRENIIYTTETIKKIEDRIRKAREELNTLVSNKVNRDYNDIFEYNTVINSTIKYDPISDEVRNSGVIYYKILLRELKSNSVKYKGEDLSKYASVITSLAQSELPNFKCVIYDDKIYSNKRLLYSIYRCKTLSYDKIIILDSNAKLSPTVKAYLRKKYNKYTVLTEFDESGLKAHLKGYPGVIAAIGNNTDVDTIINGFYESIMGKAIKLDLLSDTEFLDFKEEYRKQTKRSVKEIYDIIFHVCNRKTNYRKVIKISTLSEAIKYIGMLQQGVVLIDKSLDYNTISEIATLRGYSCIQTRQNVVKEIKGLNLKCIVDTDWLLNKDPMLSVVHTIVKHFPSGIDTYTLNELRSLIDPSLSIEFDRIGTIARKYSNNNTYRTLAHRDTIPDDPYTDYICKKLKDYLDKYREVREILREGSIPACNNELSAAVIVRTKAFRINKEAYDRIRNNKFIKILCRK